MVVEQVQKSKHDRMHKQIIHKAIKGATDSAITNRIIENKCLRDSAADVDVLLCKSFAKHANELS